MRQVDRDELAYTIAQALRTAPRSVVKALLDGRVAESTRARAAIGLHVVDSLRHLEVLTERDLPALMGERAFSVPLARMLGEDVAAGSIPIDDPTDPRD